MLPLHQFVQSTATDLGVGKLVEADEDGQAVVEYFPSPVQPRHRVCVRAGSVQPAILDRQTRVYFRDPQTGRWRAGRVLEPKGWDYFVAFPNDDRQIVACEHLFVRWDRPIDDPTGYLAIRINETPRFHRGRFPLVEALVEQRRCCSGMTGLLSSVIYLESYQVEVVRRVLQDPVQRYLLADEVGLGKTVEAGVLIRQYVLDRPKSHQVLVLVPDHLVEQWRDELTLRFRLGPLLDRSVHVRATSSAIPAHPQPGMLVLDEAHHLAAWASQPVASLHRHKFDRLRELAHRAERLLLLSATPVLYDRPA
jgi:ATP-dependent helicase HepA